MLASEALDISFLPFKLSMSFRISWSLYASPSIITKSEPLYSIELYLTLLGTDDATWAKTLKLIDLFDTIDLLSFNDLVNLPSSLANLFFSSILSSWSVTTWS